MGLDAPEMRDAPETSSLWLRANVEGNSEFGFDNQRLKKLEYWRIGGFRMIIRQEVFYSCTGEEFSILSGNGN